MVSWRLRRALHQGIGIFVVLGILAQSSPLMAASWRPAAQTAPEETSDKPISAKPVTHASAAVPPAPPPLPSSFYGTLTADNQTLSPDITLSAHINQSQYAQTTIIEHEGQWVYTLKVPADNPATEEVEGGRPGDTITFMIQDMVVATAPWAGGANAQLDLTVESLLKTQAEAETPAVIWLLLGIVFLLLLAAAVIRYRSFIITFLRDRFPNDS